MSFWYFRWYLSPNMCRLKNCCGYIDLRTGCIIIAAFGILFEIVNIILNFTLRPREFDKGFLIVPYLLWTIFNALGVVIYIGLWILLLVGVLTRSSTAILIQLICLVVIICGDALFFVGRVWVVTGVASISDKTWTSAWTTYIVVMLVYQFVGICLFIYFAVVVSTYRQSIRMGEFQTFLPYPVWVSIRISTI